MGHLQEITELTIPAASGLQASWRRPGRIKLRVRQGPDQGAVHDLDAGHVRRIIGGRSRVNDVVLNDEHVSGTHFEISFDPADGVILTDLGSTNGLVVDNVRLLKAKLGPGATFQVGESVVELISADSIAVPLSQHSAFGAIFGASPVMRELFVRLEKIARVSHRLPVLLVGATGTGKELVARELHDHSPRRDAPFVAVNCATIPSNLAESYLFGHRKGAFTGASEQAGCFEAADGGTLFLDEIGELPLELQPKLLRALQEGEITRIGEHRPRKVDVRVLSATHRDLRRMVTQGEFRDDLYFRLKGVSVSLPDLAERVEDIVPLTERLLARLADNGGTRAELSEGAKRALVAHRWPGNVRELRNTIETAYFLAESPVIDAGDLGLDPARPADETAVIPSAIFGLGIKEARAEFERIYFRRLLASSGSLTEKAKRAGISSEGLRLARKRLDLDGSS